MANRRYIDFPIASTSGDTDIILIWQDGANKQTTKATFLGGLPENLEDLNDVAIAGLTNGQILRYDSVTGKWENTDQGNLDLNDLNDVSIVSPSNGQVLVYNSSTSQWENSSGGYVPYVGAVTTVDLGAQGLRAGYVRFDTTVAGVPNEQGLMFWDADDETVDIVLNGYTMKIGEDLFYPVKNQTGSTIAKGVAVRFNGTLGASGRLLIAPFIADGSVPSSRFMGVTAEEILNGEDGKVLYFGRVRGIKTNAFNEGDILYASTTVAGGYQTAIPVAPNNIVQVAAVVTKSATVGTIFVRPTLGSNINKDEGVKIVSVADKNLLQYQSGTSLWENKSLAQVLGGTSAQFVKGDGSLDSSTYGTGTVTSVGLSSATSGVTIGSTPVTTSGTITLAIATASGSQNGLLSSTDWTTFNNKAPSVAGGYLPLSGGTLTGALNGTSAAFSSFGRFGGWNIASAFGVNTGANTSIYMDEVDSLSAQLSCVNNANNAVRTLIIQQPGGQTTFKGNVTVDKSSPILQLNAPTGTANEYRLSNSVGTTHWSMYSIIGGGNSQGNWGLYSLGKTGGAGAVLEITPAGGATFSSSVTALNLDLKGTATVQGNTFAPIDFYNSGNNAAAIRPIRFNDETAADLTFWTREYLGSLTERLKITYNGNVGIGVTSLVSPGASRRLLQISNSTNGALIALGSSTSESNNPRIFSGQYDLGFAAGVTTGNIVFYTNDNEKIRVTTDGLTFNGDTAAANALDDYEEGNWTPSVGGNATYNAANKGIYTKIGNVVTCQFRLHITTIGTGSAFQLSGLPFSSANITDVQSGHCSYYQDLAVNTIYLAFYIENNATTVQFVGKSTSGATTDNAISLFKSGTIIYGQITYRTS